MKKKPVAKKLPKMQLFAALDPVFKAVHAFALATQSFADSAKALDLFLQQFAANPVALERALKAEKANLNFDIGTILELLALLKKIFGK